MAINTTLRQRTKLLNARQNIVDIDLVNERYRTGGISIPASKLGLGIAYVVVPAPSGGYVYEYDHSANKLKAFTFGTKVGVNLPDVRGASIAADSQTVDKSAVVNGDYIVPFTAMTVAAGNGARSWVGSVVRNPDVARNVNVCVKNTAGASKNANATAVFTVVGTYKGSAQTDTITITFSTVGIAAGKYRWASGDKPFDTIASVGIAQASLDGTDPAIVFGVGLGNMIAIPGGFTAHGNVLSITAGTEALAHGDEQVDGTEKTVLVKDDDAAAILTDGTDVRITYEPNPTFGDITDAEPKEIPDYTQFGGKIRCMAIGI